MKKITNILQPLSLSLFLAVAMAIVAMDAQASDNILTDKNKDKEKKTESGLSLVPKLNLSLDAGFRYTGSMNVGFKQTEANAAAFNIKSVMTFKKGNVTYVLPYATQVQQPSNMNYHRVQIVLPLKRN
jgi:hypothetical protein